VRYIIVLRWHCGASKRDTNDSFSFWKLGRIEGGGGLDKAGVGGIEARVIEVLDRNNFLME
jgi:hypothetical protein